MNYTEQHEAHTQCEEQDAIVLVDLPNEDSCIPKPYKRHLVINVFFGSTQRGRCNQDNQHVKTPECITSKLWETTVALM